MKFVIEHMEDELYEWCKIEYEQISKYVGAENLIFTNIRKEEDREFLDGFGETHGQSIKTLGFQKACILDPESKSELTKQDRKEFDYFIFGGILGDFPPRKRTEDELTSKMRCETRNMGQDQMSTDTAVLVAKTILDGSSLSKIEFQKGLVIETGDGEEVHLPYKYVIKDGEIIISPNLVGYLSRENIF